MHTCRSRSSEVVDFGTNRKGVCEIWRVIGWKLRIFPTPPLFDAPSPLSGGTRQNFWMKLTAQKLEGWATVWWKLHDPNFNRFWLIHPCDGRTDRRTDEIAIAYARLAYMLSRAKIKAISILTWRLQASRRQWWRLGQAMYDDGQ